MGSLRYKLIHDLWSNKGRTLQVVLIIGIGAGAIGMILGTRNLAAQGMQAMWRRINPAMLDIVSVTPPISEQQLLNLRKVEGVSELDAYSNTTIEWRLGPDQEWQPGGLTARIDYSDQRLNKVELLEGEWPGDETLGIETGSDAFFGIHLGDRVMLRVDNREYTLPATGVLYYQINTPAIMGGSAQFYVAPWMYERMTGDRDFNWILVSAPAWDETAVKELGDRLQSQLEKIGIQSGRFLTDPNKHYFQEMLDGIFLLLGVLGTLALVLGLLLVYNTVNALISQQIDQIGIMKAVGARAGQIFLHYLSVIMAYSLLALLVALLVGIFGAHVLSGLITGLFAAPKGGFEVDTTALIAMLAVALLAPLLASIAPLWSGSRTTVRNAISTYGLSHGAGLLERVFAHIRWVSRLVLVTLSNTFRHKRRILLLQISLVMSGLMFMMVVSVRDSIRYTINDVMFSILSADATYLFNRPERIQYVEEMAGAYPGVTQVEMWGWMFGAEIRPRGQPRTADDKTATLLGVPLPTHLYNPQLRAGRWLVPEDSYAIVLNQRLAQDVGVSVGDWVTLRYPGKGERDWQVVGLIFDPLLITSANVPREPLLRDTGSVGRAQTAWVKSDLQDDASLIALAENLRKYFDANHVEVNPQPGVFGSGYSTVETGNAIIAMLNMLVILLAIMAVIIGLVGSIALSGALSLSVLERRREVGVMRAIGASSWSIFRLFIGEGLILGWLSALLSWPLSLPAGQLMVKVLGMALNLDIQYRYTPAGALLWLGIITLLSILASWLPARGATRISVRESLAYQ